MATLRNLSYCQNVLFLRQYAHLWTCRSLLLRTEEPNAHSLTPPPPQHKCRFQHFHAKTEDFPSRLIQCPSRNAYHPEQQGTYFRGTTDADSCMISRRLCRPPSGRFSFAFLCCVFDGADVLSARLVRELVANRFDQSGDLFSDAMPPTVPQPMPLDLILTTIRNSKAVVVYKGKAQNADVQQAAQIFRQHEQLATELIDLENTGVARERVERALRRDSPDAGTLCRFLCESRDQLVL